MITLLKIFILSLPVTLFGQETYRCHKQICSGLNAVDRKWELIMSDDGSYVFNIYSINSKALVKQKSERYSGSWEISGDTLRLKYKQLLESSFVFLRQEEKLIPLRQPIDTITGYRMQIDYLEKERFYK
ncbi:MAG: hypothetical protein K2P88_17360 [Chitinophagaceae bacterium]|nr:hypothetical protein [Chitinophagaceae bacterium]